MLKHLASLILCLSFTTLVFSDNAYKLREECLKPTISLRSDDSAASAFVIRSELVGYKYRNVAITANHCVLDKTEVWVGDYDKKGKLKKYNVYPFYLYKNIAKYDLAVFVFESDEPVATATLGFEEELEFGMEVLKIGFGAGDDARLDEGKITLLPHDVPGREEPTIRANAYSVFGDSGGPLFNKKNKVIGVCHGLRVTPFGYLFNQAYFTPITLLKTWNKNTNNAINFVCNLQAPMPVMAFSLLKWRQFDIVEHELIPPPPCP